jgi:1-pyrroline-5-carboxylate dehydrogenase
MTVTDPLVAAAEATLPLGTSIANRGVVPAITNEPMLDYAPGSRERAAVEAEVGRMGSERIEIPLVIGGRDVATGELAAVSEPHDHGHVLADVHQGGAEEVRAAVDAAEVARRDWSRTPWEERAAVFLRAADLLSGPWRARIVAATMLGQSKTVHQAEIDAAAELADFWRFNVRYMTEIYADQPDSSPGVWNRLDYRPLEGFVFAVSPFNFTAIGGNLAGAPALLGNTVVWKPAHTQMLSAYGVLRLLEEAGLPPGVINLVTGPGKTIGDAALAHRDLGGVHFTGSTPVFQGIWSEIGQNIGRYRSYPRIVGETGGKNFVVAHASADPVALVANLIRGAFEYQGQKCSATSRAYIPDTLWDEVLERLEAEVATIRVGSTRDLGNFMGAVIDGASHGRLVEALALARRDGTIVTGGSADGSTGWFVEPTIVAVSDPGSPLFRDEFFGPILALHRYRAADYAATLDLVDQTAEYALTGSIFARDRAAILTAHDRLRASAGNFYVNDKSTGAVVGQQPFGGARASGTNDKAGSKWNLMRWLSLRTIKETLVPAADYRYPFLG